MWPDIPYAPWRETRSALHLFTQVVGKYRLARTPWVNHSWHATLYVSARGLTTSIVPDGPGGVEIAFDLLDHAVIGAATDGRQASFPLAPMSVAEFRARLIDLLRLLGATPEFDGRPNEVPDPIPFAEDKEKRPYDAEAVTRFFHALVAIDRVMKRFRTAYLGKVSPVHLFWGSFDLAVTRFCRLLAGGRQRRLSGRVLVRLPKPEWIFRGAAAAGRGLLRRKPRRVPVAVRGHPPVERSGGHAHGVPAKHLRRRRGSGRLGP